MDRFRGRALSVIGFAAIMIMAVAVPAAQTAQAASRAERAAVEWLKPGQAIASGALFDTGLTGVSAVSATDAFAVGSHYVVATKPRKR